jgi:TorA-specific chaperone
MNAKEAQAFWQQLATQPEFKAHINVMVNMLAKLKTEEQLLELAADYCGLFLVGSQNSASPYASLYIGNQEATLFGEPHQQITVFLQQKKLQIQSSFPEPADHIAVILAYAGYLALNANIEEQAHYLQEHVANWLSEFVAKVKSSDSGNFYSALAQLTLAWINSELEYLVSL